MKQVLFSIALLLPVLTFAESMYKWTDENGVVHFSTTPPVEQMETELLNQQSPQLISNGAPPSPEEAPGSDTEQPTSSPTISLSNEAEKNAYCSSLNGNLVMLKSTPRLKITRANGESEVLDDAGRQKEAARIQGLLDKFCNN
ncbi:DUF4124 domain-containing protein [uncultured Endozoicomonas sp.]|uniref:DUF4124 domain-containing protein n=1 Tax=uncultured Endozoicomonas sp. TaxID=432652 RepID=UPI00260F816D|nr:DUF4124 domain-containing protein [uncultured Endozoicomonas sp.]